MYEIYPLKIGQATEEEPRIFYLGSCKKRITVYQYMWLIKGNGNLVLVDTGFTREAGQSFNPDVKQEKEEEPLKQLSSLGIKPEEISSIILTHGHWDHLSPTVFAFSNARVYLQERELLSLTKPSHPWFTEFVFKDVIRKLTDDCKRRLRIIAGDKEILPGIRLFWTGGHTPGHQSVAVNTKAGKVILTGDVVFTYRNIEKDIPVGFNCNLEDCFQAMKRIRKEADIVIPGHDPRVLEKYNLKIPK